MAKKKGRSSRADQSEEMERIDIFYIPKSMADMYRVLRQSVLEEVEAWARAHFDRVARIQDKDQGETIVAETEAEPNFSYPLNPNNISQAQKARDKGQLETYLESYYEEHSQA